LRRYCKNHLQIKSWISYAELQFGDRIPGKAYRERSNGEQIENWVVEVEILFRVNNYLASTYLGDESLGMKGCDNLIAPYYEKMIALLRPWYEYLNLNFTFNGIDRDRINYVLKHLSQKERNFALIYIHNSELNLAVDHCQLALYYARLY
jgi:hypothetical protein